MKITRTNKEFGSTIEFACSECGVVLGPVLFVKYGDDLHINFDEFGFCSCGADLSDKFVHEVLSDENRTTYR